MSAGCHPMPCCSFTLENSGHVPDCSLAMSFPGQNMANWDQLLQRCHECAASICHVQALEDIIGKDMTAAMTEAGEGWLESYTANGTKLQIARCQRAKAVVNLRSFVCQATLVLASQHIDARRKINQWEQFR